MMATTRMIKFISWSFWVCLPITRTHDDDSLLDASCLLGLKTRSTGNLRSAPSMYAYDRYEPPTPRDVPIESVDDSPNMNPTQFLLASSPSLGKIVWTELHNFGATRGRSFALISTGLTRPKGIAVDKKRGYLYVADQGASALYRYQLVIDSTSGIEAALGTTGLRASILEGYPVEWVAVDDNSNLYFTSTDKNTVNKIAKEVIDKVVTLEYRLDAYEFVPEKTLEAEAAMKNALLAQKNASLPDDNSERVPQVLQLYDSHGNAHVSSPEALWVDGKDLYWSNSQNGKKLGTILKGSVDPTHYVNGSSGRTSFPLYAVTNSSMNAFGFARAGPIVYFSTCTTTPQMCKVNSVLLSTGDVLPAVTTLQQPRGIAWDGDGTIYVADEAGGIIWSFPSGRFMSHVPLEKTVPMEGAFGLLIISETDPCFQQDSFDASQLERLTEQRAMSGVAAKSSAASSGFAAVFFVALFAGWS